MQQSDAMPIVLIPPARGGTDDAWASYQALADQLQQAAPSTPIFWAESSLSSPQTLNLKNLPTWLAQHQGATILSHQALPDDWLILAHQHHNRVILTKQGDPPEVPPPGKHELWLLDCPKPTLGLWHRSRYQLRFGRRWRAFDVWCPSVSKSADPASAWSAIFVLKPHTDPKAAELISEVAQVVAIRRQLPALLICSDNPPPDLDHVVVQPFESEALLATQMTHAQCTVTNSWHRLLMANSMGQPALAIVAPGDSLTEQTQQLQLPNAQINRRELTRAILCLSEPIEPIVTNELITAVNDLLDWGHATLGHAVRTGYTTR